MDSLFRAIPQVRPACESRQWRPSTALRTRPGRHISVIEVSGLGSIMVVFVFLFVAPGLTVIPPHRASVDLPQSQHGSSQEGESREVAVVVVVSRDGTVLFGNDKIPPQELAHLLQGRVKAGSERRVYLRADARAKYWDVEVILDQIRLAGIENITVMTHQTNH
jgi:biopolymer transport protein ExbD